MTDVHIVVSRIGDSTYIKVSETVDRLRAIGLLSDAVFMLQTSTASNISPEDCRLQVIMSVEEIDDAHQQ